MSCRCFLLVLLLVLPLAAAGQGVRTVVIDPGHGGDQPGTVWGKIYEKDINLEVALILGQMMKEQMPEVNVLYTRTSDVRVDLAKRAKVANDAKADLFISIHVNATDKNVTPPSGALTLVMGKENEGGNLDMAMKENDAIFYEDDYTTTYKDYLSGSSEMFIIYSVMQYANIDKSIRFASAVQKHFKVSTPMPDLGIRRQKLLVLWHTTMPGVLIELGFLNNARDREVLTTTTGKRKMAAAILDGIREFGKGELSEVVIPATKTTEETAVKQVEKPAEKRAEKRSEKSGTFAIQILSTTRKIPKGSSELKGYKAVEKYKGGRYRYYIGPYATRAEAQAKLPEIRRSFKDAFITDIE